MSGPFSVDPESLPPLCDVKSNISSASLFDAAQSYWTAAYELVGEDAEAASNGATSVAIYALIGFAVELALKAHLLDRGSTLKTLEKEVGHDLRKALRLLFDLGYESRTAIEDLVDKAADLHLYHGMRYLPNVAHIKTYDLAAGVMILQQFMIESLAILYRRGSLPLLNLADAPPFVRYLLAQF